MTSQLYETVRQFTVALVQKPIEVVSKPGLSDWDAVLPSTQLLAEFPLIPPTDKVLLFGTHSGALSVALARKLPHGQLWITDRDNIALEMTRKTLAANRISSVNILTDSCLPELDGIGVDAVLMQLPKGRKLTRRWLLQAYQALIPGGSLYLAGANKSGIKSAIGDAQELYGKGQILAYKKGNRLTHLVKNSTAQALPAWTQEPGILPGTWMEFSAILSNHNFQIHSLPGVFSYDHLDAGTQMLLNAMCVPSGARVLDVGCGYGIIGMYAAFQGASWVDLVDNDLLAISSCKETISLNQIGNTSILAGDLLDPFRLKRYDLILSNPPFHAGLEVNYQITAALIEQSYHMLNPGGQITIVANRFIPYDHLMEDVFGDVSCLVESGKFRLLSAIKSK